MSSSLIDPEDRQALAQLVDTAASSALRPNLVVGAGLSIGAGYPDWKALLKRLAERAKLAKPEETVYVDQLMQNDTPSRFLWLAEKLRSYLTEADYFAFLSEQFSAIGRSPTATHQSMATCPFQHILTTNYDDLIQAAHVVEQMRFREAHFLDAASIRDLHAQHDNPKGDRWILHAHGTIRHPPSIVLTQRDFNNQYTSSLVARELLRTLLGRPTLFVGYSFDDPWFTDTLARLKALFGGSSDRYFTLQGTSATATGRREQRDRLFDEFGLRAILYDDRDKHAAFPALFGQTCSEIREARGASMLGTLAPTQRALSKPDLVHAGGEARLESTSTQAVKVIERTVQDDAIDEAFSHVKEGRPEVTEALLRRMVTTADPETAPRLLFRLHANLGHALWNQGQQDAAAKQYLMAFPHDPSRPDAKLLKALALMVEGDRGSAYALAAEVAKSNPEIARAHALQVRNAPDALAFEEIEARVPAAIRGDVEVAAALASAAGERSEWVKEEEYARLAATIGPTGCGAKSQLAVVLAKKVTREGFDRSLVVGDSIHRALLEEAERLCTEVIQSEAPGAAHARYADDYLNRASIRGMLGRDSEADADREEAHRRSPKSLDIAVSRAFGMLAEDDAAGAIKALESLPDLEQDYRAIMAMGQAAIVARDKTVAKRVLQPCENWLKRLDEVFPARMRPDAVLVVARLEQLLGHSVNLDRLLTLVPRDSLTLVEEYWTRAMVAEINGDQAAALGFVKSALEAMSSSDSPVTKRAVAVMARRNGLHREAFDLLREIIKPESMDADTPKLLMSARECGEYLFILDHCKALRRNGHADAGVYELEIETHVRFRDWHAAEALAAEWIEKNPSDWVMKLKRVSLALQQGRFDRVSKQDVGDVPSPKSVDSAQRAVWIMQIVRAVWEPRELVEYGYALSRRFPHDMGVQASFVMAVLNPFQPLEMVDPSTVDRRSSVRVKRQDRDEEWITVIQDDDVNPTPGEYLPTHPLVVGLQGLAVGQSSEIGGLRYEVVSIEDRVLRRFRWILSHFSDLFPGQRMLKEFRLAKPVTPGMDPREAMPELWKELTDQEAKHKALEADVAKAVFGVVTAAQLTGRSILETMLSFAAKPSLGIQTALGNHEEAAQADRVLAGATEIVLDATALGTLFLLGNRPEVWKWPVRFIVAASSVAELRHLVWEHKQSREPRSTLYAEGGQLRLQPWDAEGHKRWVSNLEEFVDSIDAHCEIEGGLQTAAWESQRREEFTQVLGECVTDSIAIAIARRCPVWLDDLQARHLCQHGQQVECVDAQAVFSRYSSTELADSAKLELWRNNYKFVRLNLNTVLRLLRERRWIAKDREVTRLVEYVAEFTGSGARTNLLATLRLLWTIWWESPSAAAATPIIESILDRLPNHLAKWCAHKLYRLKLPRKEYWRFKRGQWDECSRFRGMLRRWRSRTKG